MRTKITDRLTALVVDDEPLARAGLRMLLSDDPGVATVLEATGGREAVTAIRGKRPDLVFLDVQMPEMDGLAVVKEIGAERMPAVVFVTAHDQYAIQAFELNAIDYLLKPVTKTRFAQTLDRARLRLKSTDEANRQMMALLEAIATPRQYLERVAIRSSGKTTFVPLEDVHWMQAAENYVELHTATGRHLLRVTLSTLEASLDPGTFLRIHRSLIVNVHQIKELQPAFHGEYVVILHSGDRLQSSRTYHEPISRWAANPF
jgi:two-component system, LytTR family, response regulator